MRKSDFIFNKNCTNTAYVLGFIWADGYLNCRDGKHERVNTEIAEKDFNEIYYLFNNIGIHLFSTKRQRNNRQPQATFGYSDKNFISFLIENDFLNRKEKGFNKILSNFNEKTINFFIKGLFDGDGCYYINEKRSIRQISLSSSLNQNYSGIDKLFNSLNIKYKIRKVNSVNSYSILRMSSKKDCNIFINFLGNSLNVGLQRKIDKINKIKT